LEVPFNTTTAAQAIYQQVSTTGGTSYTLSAWVRTTSGTASFSMGTFGGTTNFSNHTATTTWQRFSFVVTIASSGVQAFYPLVFNGTASTAAVFQIWGAQLEAGAFATSYIPTTTASVTRAADVAQISGSNFSGMYNQNAGTLFANAAPISNLYNNGAPMGVEPEGGAGGTDFVQLRFATNTIGANYRKTGSGVGDIFPNPLVFMQNGVFAKLATSFDFVGGGRSLSVNGQPVVTSSGTAAWFSTMDKMGMGSRGGTTSTLNGWLSSLAYYRTRLTDTQLQALTA
jgi:hypothetical protein